MRKQFCQTALGNCYGLKLPKCWLQFKKKIISLCQFFGTLSFPMDEVPGRDELSVAKTQNRIGNCK